MRNFSSFQLFFSKNAFWEKEELVLEISENQRVPIWKYMTLDRVYRFAREKSKSFKF